jgi:serine phosphatase RsbU (regulator of sigma subunit)
VRGRDTLPRVSEFVFRPLAIPFLCLAAGVLAMVLVVMLRRGDLPIRAGFISTGILGFTWSAGTAVVMCSTSADLARLFSTICAGALVFIGPSSLLLFLALCGLLTQLRRLLYGFAALAAVLCVASWTTDLVIRGVWLTSWGIWVPEAGSLYPLHLGVLALPMLVGLVLVHRIRREHRNQPYRRYLTVAVVSMLLSLSDVLLYYRIGVYPFSVVPSSLGVGFTLWSLFRTDLLHARGRGIDWGAAWELGLIVLLVPMVAIVTWVASRYGTGGGPWLAILLIVPLYGAMQGIILIVRSYLSSDGKPVLEGEAELALEEFGELVKEPRSQAAVGELLAELLGKYGQFTAVVLYVVKEGKSAWTPATSDEPGSVAASPVVERWLYEQRRMVMRRELLIRRQGKLREALLETFERLAADVLIPLVERGKLVGVVAGKLPPDTRELDPAALFLLRRATRLTARALIYLDLFRDALERIEMARELEVAASSRVTREPGEQRHLYDLCEVIGYYHATRQVGGDFWTSYELDDGRVLVVMGDVAEHGMPTALVSATVAGACETALRVRGAAVDLVELMAVLDQAVRSVGGERRYDMGCFAALLEDGRISFASAGHPPPWVCRRPMTGGRDDELRPLEAGGERLGSAAAFTVAAIRTGSFELTWSDIVVMCSESLMRVRSPEGEPFGERRLPRLLRRQARMSGGRLPRVIMDDLLTHAGDQSLTEDFSLVIVRMGAGRSRRRARTTDASSDMRPE